MIIEGVALLLFGLSSVLYVTAVASFVVSAMIPIGRTRCYQIGQPVV
jgi:hypothetical protein